MTSPLILDLVVALVVVTVSGGLLLLGGHASGAEGSFHLTISHASGSLALLLILVLLNLGQRDEPETFKSDWHVSFARHAKRLNEWLLWCCGAAFLTGVVLALGAPRSGYVSSLAVGALHECLALSVLVLGISRLLIEIAGRIATRDGGWWAKPPQRRTTPIRRDSQILDDLGELWRKDWRTSKERASYASPLAYLSGCIAFSIGIKLFIEAGLGADPLHALAVAMVGPDLKFGIGFAASCITIVLLALWTLLTRTLPPLSTFVTMALVGYLVDLWNYIELERYWLEQITPFSAVLVGLVFEAYGSALIIMSGIGIRAVDLVAVALMRHLRCRFFIGKLLLEGSFVAAAWFMSGPVGIATVAFLLLVGPFVEPMIHVNERLFGLDNRGFELPLAGPRRHML